MNEESIFAEAVDKPAEEQAAYLAEACGGDEAMRKRVEALLAARQRVGAFMSTPAADDPELIDRSAMETLGPPPGDHPAMHHPIHTPAEDEEPLTFLTPSKRRDSLGRIGHYEILQVLGRGGFGIVFRAFDDVLQRVVALKVLAPQMAASSPARKRFLREARSSAQVRHENVVQVYAVEEQPLPYLVMEFIPGETLQQKLGRMGPLDVAETLRIGRQIAEGLAAAHAMDLIHRDIKPGNVLIEAGPQGKVKITDFGLARAADDASMTQSGILSGTPMFMAPEQALGHVTDQRADLFGLGSVLYQMVAGRPPFRASSTFAVLKRVAEDKPRPIRELIPETPQWLCDVIAKLHEKKPEDRYQSAREVADVLADCEAQLKVGAKLKDFSRIPHAVPRQRSGGGRKWAAAAVVLLPLIALAATELVRKTYLARKPQLSTAVVLRNLHVPGKSAVAPEAEGWVQLFNGKDLTGWKTAADAPGHWEVKDGILIGGLRHSNLFSERGDYGNFHLRVEAKINMGGDSGVFFRTGLGTDRARENGPPESLPGYEADIHKNSNVGRQIGTVMALRAGQPLVLGVASHDSLTRPDEWFTLEIIAEGDHFITKVNGKETVNCHDPLNEHSTGRIALQVWNPRTLVQFRKIEIKELPASPPARPTADEWVQLFNGKDTTGWEPHADLPGDWKVVNGVLVGSSRPGYLFSSADDFDNFHLRVEVSVNRGGDSGIFIRAPFTMREGRTADQLRPAGGFEIENQNNPAYNVKTGSIWDAETAGLPKLLSMSTLAPLPEGADWIVLEIIAQGDHVITKVNGVQTGEAMGPAGKYVAGRLALQCFTSRTVVQFRRIEIKRLLPPATAEAKPSN